MEANVQHSYAGRLLLGSSQWSFCLVRIIVQLNCFLVVGCTGHTSFFCVDKENNLISTLSSLSPGRCTRFFVLPVVAFLQTPNNKFRQEIWSQTKRAFLGHSCGCWSRCDTLVTHLSTADDFAPVSRIWNVACQTGNLGIL